MNVISQWFGKLGGALFVRKVAAAFAAAFLTTFALGVSQVGTVIVNDDGVVDWTAGRSALWALIVGSIVAGLRAAQALFTNWETPPAPPAE